MRPDAAVAIRERRVKYAKRRKAIIFGVIVVIGLGVVAQGYDSAPLPVTIAKSNPLISNIRPYPDGLLISADIQKVTVPADALRQIEEVSRDIGQSIQDGATDFKGNPKWITLQATVPVKGADREAGRRIAFTLLYRTTDVRGNQKGGPFDMLNLAREVWVAHPTGDVPLQAFCREFNSPAKAFCTMAGGAG